MRMKVRWRGLHLAAALALIAACLDPASDRRAPPPPPGANVLVGAGDIANCTSTGAEATADLLDTIPGVVFTAGDNAYQSGSASDYAQCYEPTWGRHKTRTRPSPGNHDFVTDSAAPYYSYFGANAGDSGVGYYSYDVGAWHVISLNSSISVAPGSPQEAWLRRDLGAHRARCTLAYWHFPRFSAGLHGSLAAMQPLWQALYDSGADVVLAGHDHNYQRFAPQTPAGALDSARGIREFVVGTGGASHYTFPNTAANLEVKDSTTFGVLKLTLDSARYAWVFVPVAGATFSDSGTASCH
ncbi:MAG TPA: metallophosphoesterase [Gemmatimonadales bacterium]|nr:metallophosphoesterase [Gemmatimonadales bacterium]